MSRMLRKRPRISYYEPDEPNLDEYVFCAECADFVYEYCAIHGPLLVIPDDKVPAKTNLPPIVPRAALTIPHVFLHLARSVIPGAGIGVFSTLTLPRGVRFGPYRGQRTNEVDSMYCWQIYDANKKPSHVIDAMDANRSNWMRYVNCSRHWGEQNLIAYQYQGQIYYRTIKIVPRFTELMVFYGSEFANLLDVDLKRYNSPPSYAEKMGTVKPIKSTLDQKEKKPNAAPQEAEEKRKTTLKGVVLPSKNNLKDPKLHMSKTISKERNAVLNVSQTAKTEKGKFDETDVKENSTLIKHNQLKIINKQNTIQTSQVLMKQDKTITTNITNELVLQKTIQNNDLSCDICLYQALSDKQLSRHLKAHAADKSFDCALCLYKTLRKRNLVYHMNSHLGITYSCDVCKKTFSQKSNLEIHYRIHSGLKPYSCDVCNKTFRHKGYLEIHYRIHSGLKPYSCDVCNKTFRHKGYLEIHYRIHSGLKPYSCDVCKKTFRHKGSLEIHCRIHSGLKPYSCDVCNKTFRQKGDLGIHYRIHSGLKPYSCDVCKKTFRQKGYLEIHYRIHSGLKPYSCDVCNKTFRYKGSLEIHCKIHSGLKPYSCDVCKKTFSQKGSLERHYRIHSGLKPYSCDVCNKTFSEKSNLNRHNKIHSGLKPYSCDVCNKTFRQKGDLGIHCRIHLGHKPY